MSDLAIQVNSVHKSYRMGRSDLHVLRGLSLSVAKGEFASIVGASGSGKSTLLHIIGLLDRTDRGEVILDGVKARNLSAGQRNRIRCNDVGFVFQFYHLLGELSVLENVLLPAKVNTPALSWPDRRKEARDHAKELIGRLGLADRMKHRPGELSGGERQRVAIARALANQPKILLADEPTGNLDSKSGRSIMEVLKAYHSDYGQTVLMVTHDMSLAEGTDRVLHLTDGRLGK